ncbi:MAG TPA: alpha/beta hydrolase [Acidimicrobiia bacterium]|nr:alpha/beta hydrolase [Acidimicrobiia bacterium]
MSQPEPAPGAPSLAGRVHRRYEGATRWLNRRPLLRALVAAPRTAAFLSRTVIRRFRGSSLGIPAPDLSPGFIAQAAMDETILALAMGPNRFPRRADYERVGAELGTARELFEQRGWSGRPHTYHREPPPLEHVTEESGWALGQSYVRIRFPSGYQPRPEEPGAQRWAGYEANRTASAAVLRHPGEARPWVVAIHGFGMGIAFMDFVGLQAIRLHRDLGLNVVLPVLPLHGSRRLSRVGGEQFLGFDLMNTVHGLAQSAWDVRRVIGWARAQGAPSVGLYGVSLGGYTAALVAGIEPDLDCVIAGIPVVDFPTLIHAHSPLHIRLRSIEHAILGGNAEEVHRVVSPLAIDARVPRERRFIYAGLADRLARPAQAQMLWSHWQEPSIEWFGGNHVGYLWSSAVRRYLVEALVSSGLERGVEARS